MESIKPSVFILAFVLLFPGISSIMGQGPIDSLRSELAAAKDDSLKIALLIDLSRTINRTASNSEEALDLATEAMQLAADQDSVTYSQAMNNLGLLLRYHQQFEESLGLHIRAYKMIAARQGLLLDKMIYANNAAVSARYMGAYDLAVEYHLIALRIAEAENDLRNIEIASNGLGNTFMAIPGRQNTALEYLDRALDAALKSNNRRGIAIQYLTIGGYYDELKEHGKARKYFLDLLKINEDIGDEHGRSMAFKALGESYMNAGDDLRRAEGYFRQALEIFEQLDDKQQQAQSWIELSKLSFKRGQHQRSLAELERAAEIARKLNNKVLMQNISSGISEVYEALRNYPLALSYYKQARDYQDSINLTNQAVQISAINRRYNLEKKESEIELLKAEQSLNAMQMEEQMNRLRSRGAIILLLIALFVTLVVAYVLVDKQRKRKQKAELLLQAAEKDRMKADYERNIIEGEMLANQMRINPHFLFNSLNAIKHLIQQDLSKQAIKYLVLLARFSRQVLETAKGSTHSLSEELSLVRNYIELEKSRFDDRFTCVLDVPEDVPEDIQIPPLLLQPFIENAIWHGLLPSDKELKVLSLSAELTDRSVLITIRDNGVGRFHVASENRRHKSRGTEINNKRIALFNTLHQDTLLYEFKDHQDDQGNALGTSVEILLKKSSHDENSHS